MTNVSCAAIMFRILANDAGDVSYRAVSDSVGGIRLVRRARSPRALCCLFLTATHARRSIEQDGPRKTSPGWWCLSILVGIQCRVVGDLHCDLLSLLSSPLGLHPSFLSSFPPHCYQRDRTSVYCTRVRTTFCQSSHRNRVPNPCTAGHPTDVNTSTRRSVLRGTPLPRNPRTFFIFLFYKRKTYARLFLLGSWVFFRWFLVIYSLFILFCAILIATYYGATAGGALLFSS